MKLIDVMITHIHQTFMAHNCNKTRTAEALGISRMTLDRYLKKYGHPNDVTKKNEKLL